MLLPAGRGMLWPMNLFGMALAASVLLIVFIDLMWKGDSPLWWLRCAAVLIPMLLTVDAVFWFWIGWPVTGLVVALMATFFWSEEIGSRRRARKYVYGPNE